MHLVRQGIVRWAVPIGAVAAVLLAAGALPATVLADTPTRNPLDPIVEPPVDPLQVVADLAGPLIAIVVVLVIIAGLFGAGAILARIGGRPAEPTSAGAAAPRYLARSPVGRGIALVVGISAVAIGALLGRDVARLVDTGGMAMIGAGVLIVILVIVIVGLTIPALVGWNVRRRQMSPAIATIFAAGGLLALGAGGGAASFGLTGGYREPVVLQSPGRVNVELRSASLPFTARVDAPAQCTSIVDGRTVASISALDVGELGPGTMRAGIRPVGSAEGGQNVELFIDGGDLPEGSEQPFWTGFLLVSQLAEDGRPGDASFENVALALDSKTPTSTGSAAWPASLSGTINWTCDPWP